MFSKINPVDTDTGIYGTRALLCAPSDKHTLSPRFKDTLYLCTVYFPPFANHKRQYKEKSGTFLNDSVFVFQVEEKENDFSPRV